MLTALTFLAHWRVENAQKMELDSGHDVVSSRFYSDMPGHELNRFLEFISRSLATTAESLGVVGSGREIPVMVQLMRSHLRARLKTQSPLIAASNLPRGTAYRLIEAMIEDGLITKRPRSRSGKSYSLHPSRKMIARWLDYVRGMKSLSNPPIFNGIHS